MKQQRTWPEQCVQAAARIKERFGLNAALDYLIRDKLTNFAVQAERNPELTEHLERFRSAVRQAFGVDEIESYLESLRPKARRATRELLYP